jgi:hypothetical protein
MTFLKKIIKSFVFSSQNSCNSYSSVKGRCCGSSDCDFSILERRNDLKMPYKNMGTTISKHIETMTMENSDQPIADHIKQVFLPLIAQEIS